MSADNGIYIAEFPEGFRVIHAQAIENIDYYEVGTKEYFDTLKSYFGDSEVFESKELALAEACRIEDYCQILEYGIRTLGKFPSFITPKIEYE